MIHTCVIYIILSITIEALTEIIVFSELFLKLRVLVSKINPSFLGKLLSCGYCLSIWVSIPIVFFVPGHIVDNYVIDLFIKWMILHRFSNIAHEGIRRWITRAPFVFIIQKQDLTVIDKSIDIGEEENGSD